MHESMHKIECQKVTAMCLKSQLTCNPSPEMENLQWHSCHLVCRTSVYMLRTSLVMHDEEKGEKQIELFTFDFLDNENNSIILRLHI